MSSNKSITTITSIEAPKGWENTAIVIRNKYTKYFESKPGFVSSTLYQTINTENKYNFVNIVVWESREAFDNALDNGFKSKDGKDDDEMKTLGGDFPPPIKITPGQFEIIESN